MRGIHDAWHNNNKVLTDKQKQLLPCIAQDMTIREIARKLNISVSCVTSRIEKIKDTAGCLTHEELVEYAKCQTGASMNSLMSHEEEFELALQEYEKAVVVYKIAQLRYIEAVGAIAAQCKFNEAINRICRHGTTVEISQEEINRRAKLANTIVDSNACNRRQ